MAVKAGPEEGHFKMTTDGSAGARLKRCGNMSCVKKDGERCCRCRGRRKRDRCNFCRQNLCPTERS
jgi:hypothetical protein